MLSDSFKFWSTTSKSVNTESIFECKHKCVNICHPGPCGQCESVVMRSCKCGGSKFQVKCTSVKVPLCEKTCEKVLNCGEHKCELVCHSGECDPCQVAVELTCYSHEEKRAVKCGSPEASVASKFEFYMRCEKECGKLLACKSHYCKDLCHAGECKPCDLAPSRLVHCPCGKTQVKDLLLIHKLIRTSCTDPVPTCMRKCKKILKCNEIRPSTSNSEIHFCEARCHLNECPPCEKTIEIKCRCRRDSKSIKCCESSDSSAPFMCDRKCQKKKSCGRHVCNELCCPNDTDEHICVQVCNKALNCGLHKCEELCHKGACKKCLVASFDERVCNCGLTIQYPPIRCGTLPLDCTHKCARHHACEHPVTHNCHWEEKCPPCSFLTSRMCTGNHELRHNIPCHAKDVSCGKPCGKQLDKCAHRCNKTCHKGECLAEDEKCAQACQKERPHCVHKCNAICHGEDPCPDTVCNETMILKCKCGHRTKQVRCGQKMYESQTQLVFENLASQIKEMLTCKSIDINSFKKEEKDLKKRAEILECDEECLLNERSKQMAQALEINTSSVSSVLSQQKPKPVYSEFLRSFAREDSKFVLNIEKKFEIFANECRASTLPGKKSLQLPAMKPTERRFIHELASYYDMETASFDPEPFRNVCLFAHKDKVYIPSPLLSQSVLISSLNQMSRVINLKQINQSSVAPMKSNMRTLNSGGGNQALMENNAEGSSSSSSATASLKLSSAFSVLQDGAEGVDELLVNLSTMELPSQDQRKSEKAIDYFDLTD